MVGRRIKSNNLPCCYSDFDTKITIQRKSTKGNNNPNTSSTVVYEDVAVVWAMLKTTPTIQWIEGVQTSDSVNTDFYIRYDSAFDTDEKFWIESYDEKYRVVASNPNIDNGYEFMRFRTVRLGDKSINANLT